MIENNINLITDSTGETASETVSDVGTNKKTNKGRKKGSGNCSYLKWEVIIFDKETSTFKEGKFISINALNAEWNLELNADYVRRIMTKYRADMSGRNKENSFIARYGHIKIKKIHEKIN